MLFISNWRKKPPPPKVVPPEPPEAKEEAWQKALLDAANHIEAHGWCQRQSSRNDGATCMIGAIAKVCVYSKPYTRAIGQLHRLVGKWPEKWNDQPERTKEEVIAMLHKAAKLI